MTFLDDLEEIAVLPDEDTEFRRPPGGYRGAYTRTDKQRDDARARMIARNKALSFDPPRVGTYAARILSALRHGTQGTAQIAKAVFGKTKDHALELRRIQSASSILTRLIRRGFVKRVAYARWQLIPRHAARQDQESEGSKPESG